MDGSTHLAAGPTPAAAAAQPCTRYSGWADSLSNYPVLTDHVPAFGIDPKTFVSSIVDEEARNLNAPLDKPEFSLVKASDFEASRPHAGPRCFRRKCCWRLS